MAGSTRKGGGQKNGKGRSGANPTSGSETVPATRQTSVASATGQQIAWENGETEVPKGDERGSQLEIEGGDPTPTIEGGDKPRGLQAEPALFVSNGQVPHDMVPSPTGLQPVAAVAGTPEEAKEKIDQRVDEHQKYVSRTQEKDRVLDEATVGRLGKAELRAIALQRGYDVPEAGTRAIRANFLRAQSEAGSSKGPKGSKGRQGASDKSMERSTRKSAPKGGGRK